MSLIRGNALTIPLANDSVDLIVTSPPYFALRSYTDACGTCGGLVTDVKPKGGPQPLLQGGDRRRTDGADNIDPDPDCPECDGSGRGHYAGQLGSEPTPAAFIDALVSVTRECVRVLKPSGSLFVNLGDKYANAGTRQGNTGIGGEAMDEKMHVYQPLPHGCRTKSLMGLPWRYALACIDDLGLILRAEIIWSKPNGLPESVQDRVRRSHEQWFHFTLEPRYYSAVDEIREGYAPGTAARYEQGYGPSARGLTGNTSSGVLRSTADGDGGPDAVNPLGKLPGSVWTVPTEPLRVPDHLPQHFAAFPSEWPRRIILGWSPSGICCECGEGRRPVTGYDQEPDYRLVEDKRISETVTVSWCTEFADWCDESGVRRKELDAAAGTSDMSGWWASRLAHRCAVPTPDQYELLSTRWPDLPQHPGDTLWEPFTRKVAWAYGDHSDDETQGRHRVDAAPKKVSTTIIGEACACPTPTAPTRPAVVLDPFAGTGTVPAVANALGRYGVGVDLSADYLKLARWRCNDPGLRAKALGVDKPAPEVPGQMALL